MYSSRLRNYIYTFLFKNLRGNGLLDFSQNMPLYVAREFPALLCLELDCTPIAYNGIQNSEANIYLALKQRTFGGTGWLV